VGYFDCFVQENQSYQKARYQRKAVLSNENIWIVASCFTVNLLLDRHYFFRSVLDVLGDLPRSCRTALLDDLMPVPITDAVRHDSYAAPQKKV